MDSKSAQPVIETHRGFRILAHTRGFVIRDEFRIYHASTRSFACSLTHAQCARIWIDECLARS